MDQIERDNKNDYRERLSDEIEHRIEVYFDKGDEIGEVVLVDPRNLIQDSVDCDDLFLLEVHSLLLYLIKLRRQFHGIPEDNRLALKIPYFYKRIRREFYSQFPVYRFLSF